MNEPVTPPEVAPPVANYALAVRSAGPSTFLHTSGIVGTRPDGTIAAEIGEQAREVWRSMLAILAAAGFARRDIVCLTTYAVVGHELGEVMAARDEALAGHLAASVLIPVPALAQPAWLVEIAVIAARDANDTLQP